jgi:hypothetical protein
MPVEYSLFPKPSAELPLFDRKALIIRTFSWKMPCSECSGWAPAGAPVWVLGKLRAACSTACCEALLARGYAPHEEPWHDLLRRWEAATPTSNPLIRVEKTWVEPEPAPPPARRKRSSKVVAQVR